MTARAIIAIIIFSVGYLIGFSRGVVHTWNGAGYIGCKDGRLTMQNFFVDSVKSEAFHFGVNPCNGDGPAVTVEETKP